MEEKEKNERFEVLGNSLRVADNETKSIYNVLGFYDCVEILNQQVKNIEESYNNTMKWLKKTRSELLNLPKKIAEDIKGWIKSQIIYCGGKADKVDILIANANNQVLEDLQNILDTILKKYGVEDE